MTSHVHERAVRAGLPIGPHGGLLGHDYQRDPQSGAGNCVCGGHEDHRMHNKYSWEGDLERAGFPMMMNDGSVDHGPKAIHHADAEQAKSTGGMLALIPRQDFAEQLVIPGGEPLEDIHLTLIYFGEDVTEMPGQDAIVQAISGIADQFSAITARVMGHAIFNPDGEEPCAVYLISDSDDLADLHHQVEEQVSPLWDLSEQHRPYIPHITAGYSLDPGSLGFTGDIIFDRLSLHWAGEEQDFPLI